MRTRIDPNRRLRAPARSLGGFTLFEVVITLSIAAILVGLAMPAMRNFVQEQQDSSAASALISNLNYARSEAIKEDLPTGPGNGVTLCASTGAGAVPTCDTANWANGWIVSTSSAVPANPVLQTTGALAAGLTLDTFPANAAIVFQPNGTAPAIAVGANGRVEFVICDARGPTFAREVELSVTGIIQAAAQPGFDVSGAAIGGC
jgi:type IV fimbrial biogenesis protein FimT